MIGFQPSVLPVLLTADNTWVGRLCTYPQSAWYLPKSEGFLFYFVLLFFFKEVAMYTVSDDVEVDYKRALSQMPEDT